MEDVRINRGWLRRRMREGALQHKIIGKYSDDYKYDADRNFGITTEWEDTPVDFLRDSQLESRGTYSYCIGQKDGEISLSTGCDNYKFRLKKNVN